MLLFYFNLKVNRSIKSFLLPFSSTSFLFSLFAINRNKPIFINNPKMFLTQQFSATNETNYQYWHFCPHWPSQYLTDYSYRAFFLNLTLHRMQQQERKRILCSSLQNLMAQKYTLEKSSFFAEGTNLFDKVMLRYSNGWFVICYPGTHSATLWFTITLSECRRYLILSCLPAFFIWFLASTEQQPHLLSGRKEDRLLCITAYIKV